MDHSAVAIQGEQVTKVFKDFWGRNKVAALTNVDIKVNQGQIFGLLGPNGAGKSTLIKLILGHLYPSKGRIAVYGKTPRDVGVKSRIGYLPERSSLYKHLTADETLRYFGGLLHLSGDQISSRSQQLLEMVGLGGTRKRLVGEFSHGMARRLGLAQALLNDPDLLILDEPTAGLDPVGCREVKDLILTLGKRGKTILLTSHLLADVEDVCDEVMMLFGGKVQSQGRLDDLLKDAAKVRLEFPVLSEKAMTDIRAIIDAEGKAKELVSGSPTESLETYFLRIVAEGNEKSTTAGAQMGAGVADFLRDQATANATQDEVEPDREALAQLAAQPKPTAQAEPTEPEVDTAALDELNAKAEPGSDNDAQIDQALLDDLSKGS